MTKRPYEAPSIVEVGTLHELTLQNKILTGSDGINLVIQGVPNPLGPAS